MPKFYSGAEIVFKCLEDQNVSHIFGYPGGAVLPIYDELKNFNSIKIMINYFALTLTEMGIGKIELAVIGAVILIFPILFVYASKNLDAKGVFEWMMEKPNDWIGKK